MTVGYDAILTCIDKACTPFFSSWSKVSITIRCRCAWVGRISVRTPQHTVQYDASVFLPQMYNMLKGKWSRLVTKLWFLVSFAMSSPQLRYSRRLL